MLFAKRERSIRRILIVEDEPLVAFDNEHMLKDDDYEIVATVDSYADAAEAIAAHEIDLVMTDLSLAGEGTGVDVARAAQAKGVPVLFVTAHYCAEDAKALALGCLAKPYSERVLLDSLAALDRHMQGEKPKRRPKQLTLYVPAPS
jgi:two-component system, response regulator PdtaR